MIQKQVFTTDDVNKILQAAGTQDQAKILDSALSHPFLIQSMVIALDTVQLDTNPQKIGFPFRSIFVADATDNNTNVNIRIGARDTFQSKCPLKKKDSLDLGDPAAEAYLDWPAQAGKTITLLFFTRASFRSGTQINQINGGVVVSEGTTATLNSVNLAATTATIIPPINASRNVAILQNQTGADLWLGDSTVTNAGATQGIRIPDQSTYEWRNTAALYGYSLAGGRVNFLEQT